MANLMLRHLAKLSKIEQMWHLPMVCSKFSIRVNPFFRPVLEKQVQNEEDTLQVINICFRD